ncbi:hypothetical protein [Subsaximicrobium wynnwilliamsii]|nr:hypothetical protein [Subsaximicrobium wynnwilliamsii]
MFTEDKASKANFKVVDEAMNGEVAWVKHSTAYDKAPGILKVVKQNGK